MRGWIKAVLGLGAASSAVGVGFLVNNSFSKSPEVEIPETPKREKSYELFEKRFPNKKMVIKDNWEAWKKKIEAHKDQSYWPASLAALSGQSDRNISSFLQFICFDINDGLGNIRSDEVLKKNFAPDQSNPSGVNLEEVVPKLCGED